MIRYTSHFLQKLENMLTESSYEVRYEKGNFKSGYCILESKKIVIINKFYSLDGKINCLLEILKVLNIPLEQLTEKSRELFLQLQSSE
ncbi:MAG: hypothetical protein A3H98_00755 [Bacteroidetes bacterium RIFCSPLOWO2_02_FULL_36_8]|nr:MAG: hypothetical protein A3H98_00755 [Bacteroidetes bacterium RIFCSPLOWO2_02_FULL_36_8]OFY70738.1 MAG: hypothetical protein A3G23_07720 [Bacteroidetes bacterium RIFCSPLOWO2_12_FULL_37_12]